MNEQTNKLYIGTTLTPNVEIKPSNATNQQLTWKSSNTQVAKIKDGIIIGKEEGEGCSNVNGTCLRVMSIKTTPKVSWDVYANDKKTMITEKVGSKTLIYNYY